MEHQLINSLMLFVFGRYISDEVVVVIFSLFCILFFVLGFRRGPEDEEDRRAIEEEIRWLEKKNRKEDPKFPF